MTPSKHSKAPAHEVAAIDFPVVAIGASVGGLDPIVAFLSHVPLESGIAYAVIQHLDPRQKALLPELLQRATSIPVTEITHQAPWRPNPLYVIPSNADLGLSKRRFLFSEPLAATPGRSPNLNVLALEQQLIQARNDIQTSCDEVKPAKEELQVRNEELQSAKMLEARLRQIQSGAVADGNAGKRAS